MPSAKPPRFRLRPAAPTERRKALSLARAFHAEDGHPLSPSGARAMGRLMRGPEQDGFVRLIEARGEIVGYVAVCYGFSIEFGGRDAFLDDLYIAPPWRGQGLGAAVVTATARAARKAGVRALHLEVMPGNPAAGLYRRLDFTDRGALMTRLL
jgi:ribosomal protein S18 acetylase RimI-like enzyme